MDNVIKFGKDAIEMDGLISEVLRNMRDGKVDNELGEKIARRSFEMMKENTKEKDR